MVRLEVLLEVVRVGLTVVTLGLGLAIGLLVGLVVLVGFVVLTLVVLELLGLVVLAAAEALRSKAALLAWVLLELSIGVPTALGLSEGTEDGSGVLEVMPLGGLPASTAGAARRSGSGTCRGDGSSRLLDSKVPSRSSVCPGVLWAKLFKLTPVMVSANAAISARHNLGLVILEHLLWALKLHAMRSSNKKSCWQRISSPSSVLRG